MHQSQQHDDQQEPLDEWLAAAEWPAGQSPRELQRRWREVFDARPARRWWRVAAAAAVTLAIGAAAFIVIQVNASKSARTVAVVPENAAKLQAVEDEPEEQAPVVVAAQHEAMPGREPTRLELARVAAMEWRARRGATKAAVDPVRAAIEGLVNDVAADVGAVATGLMDVEPALVAAIERERGERRVAATRLLAQVGSERSLPLLVRLTRDETTRAAAMPGVLRLADVPMLSTLARDERLAADQPELLAAMLHRSGGFDAYMTFAVDSTTRPAAMKALDRVQNPPIEPLLVRMSDPRVEVRVAAAAALGRINGPMVTRRLVEMVERNQSRREALLALAWSRGAEAREYLAAAEKSPQLSGLVQSAMLQSEIN